MVVAELDVADQPLVNQHEPHWTSKIGAGAPPSLLPAFHRIREMAELPPNWDAEGADPPTPQAVAAALYLIEAIAERRRERGFALALPATSSPIPDGGLLVEWKGRNARIDVQANPDGSYGFLVKWGLGPDARYEEADEESLASLMALIDRVLDTEVRR